MHKVILVAAAVLLLAVPDGRAEDSPSIFMLRATDKSPDAVVDAIEAYAAEQQWRYLGASKVKQGQVTLVKFCIPEIGRMLWPVGLEISALLPCGNVGVYQKSGSTEISVLHPRFMQVLYPSPETEQAARSAEPLLMELLETIAK